jgi:hypothetical protein
MAAICSLHVWHVFRFDTRAIRFTSDGPSDAGALLPAKQGNCFPQQGPLGSVFRGPPTSLSGPDLKQEVRGVDGAGPEEAVLVSNICIASGTEHGALHGDAVVEIAFPWPYWRP